MPLPWVPTAFVAKTLPLPWVSTSFVAKTVPLPRVSTGFAAKTVPLPCGHQDGIAFTMGHHAGGKDGLLPTRQVEKRPIHRLCLRYHLLKQERFTDRPASRRSPRTSRRRVRRLSGCRPCRPWPCTGRAMGRAWRLLVRPLLIKGLDLRATHLPLLCSAVSSQPALSRPTGRPLTARCRAAARDGGGISIVHPSNMDYHLT